MTYEENWFFSEKTLHYYKVNTGENNKKVDVIERDPSCICIPMFDGNQYHEYFTIEFCYQRSILIQ